MTKKPVSERKAREAVMGAGESAGIALMVSVRAGGGKAAMRTVDEQRKKFARSLAAYRRAILSSLRDTASAREARIDD